MGERMSLTEISAGTPHTTLSTPLGRPASWNMRAMAMTAQGESSGPLMMMVQPAPVAAQILRMAWMEGKFEGEKAAHTAMGARMTRWRTLGWRDVMIRA